MIIICGVIFVFLIFNFGIRKTITVYAEYKVLKAQYEEEAQLPQRVATAKNELDRLNALTNSHQANENVIEPVLLQVITDFGKENDLVIKDFPKTVEKNIEDYTIEQNKVVLTGSFLNTLKLVYLLEQQKRMRHVVSADFKMILDKPSKKKLLQTTFYIQKIRSDQND